MTAKIEYQEFVGEFTRINNRYFIYLPLNYDNNNAYPIIYTLHPGFDHDLKGQCQQIMLKMVNIYEKYDKEVIIVMPLCDFNNSLWCDAYDESYLDETKFIKDLIPEIENKYKINQRYVEGFSMGGLGAVKMLFKYPELFKKAINIDGGFFTFRTLDFRIPETKEIIFNNEEYFDENDPFKILVKNQKMLKDSYLLSIIGLLKRYNKELKKLMLSNDLNIEYIPTQFKHQYQEIMEVYYQQCFDFYEI